MLRKTNHNRKSLKRQAPEPPKLELSKNTNYYPYRQINEASDFQNNNEVPRINSVSLKSQTASKANDRQARFTRKDSFEAVKKMVGVSLDIGKDDCSLKYRKTTNENGMIMEENENNLYTTEILPGFIVVGGPTIDL